MMKYPIKANQKRVLYDEQQGKCAICMYAFDFNDLFVDHDHGTGEVRGLLCNPCNTGLGMFRDRKARLNHAIHYLDRYGSGGIPKKTRIERVPEDRVWVS
jgi:hypothetical protein